jgi:hypothetical protein
MLPKFEWNTTTKLILLIIIMGSLCLLLNCNSVERFMNGSILGCPDRLYFDGTKYYLFKMNMPIIKGENPIVYQTYQEYLNNKPEKCPELSLTKPIKNELSKKKLLPVLPYQWDCQREQAFDAAKQNDCLNKTYTIFTEDECNLFKDMPARYYTNNAIERCMVKNTITDFPQLYRSTNSSQIEYSEEGLIRVGADIGGDPFRNIS